MGEKQILRYDSDGSQIDSSSLEQSFKGEYDGSDNLTYAGYARPGASSSDTVWQIRFMTYDVNNNLTKVEWPIVSGSNGCTAYRFSWDGRAALTYG